MTAPNVLLYGDIPRIALAAKTATRVINPRPMEGQRVKPYFWKTSFGDGFIRGTTNVNTVGTAGIPVYLYDKESGILLEKTISGVGGDFAFVNLYTKRRYRVTMLDLTYTYDPASADNLNLV